MIALVAATASLAAVAMPQEVAPPVQEAGADRDVARRDDALAVAKRMVAQMKEMSRHHFERFESEWAAADELREAEKEKNRLIIELSKQDPEAATKLLKDFGAYAFKCGQARTERGSIKIRLKAESPRARTTAEDVTRADATLQAALKDLPTGEGPAYQGMKAYHAKLTAGEDLRDRFNDESAVLTDKLVEVRRKWFALDGEVRARLEMTIDSWEEKLHRLREEAEEAKRASARKSDASWPEEKRWPAARSRYMEFLEQEPDLAARLKP